MRSMSLRKGDFVNKPVAKKTAPNKPPNRYQAIIGRVFEKHYDKGATEFVFSRSEFDAIAKSLKIEPPKNFGDVMYSFRYRNELPASIASTAAEGREWIIKGAGMGRTASNW